MTAPFDFPDPEEEPQPITRPARRTPPDRTPPHSAEAEEHVLACCLLEGDNGLTLRRALDAGITDDSFYAPANRVIFSVLRTLPEPSLEILGAELAAKRQLEAVGGYPYLVQITSKVPTTAHAGYFIGKLRELHSLRETIKAATRTVEEAYGYTGGLEEFLAQAEARITRIRTGSDLAPRQPQRIPSSFTVPPPSDPSVLLGNRYLNRGDGIILSGPSGMGKSSLSLQAAAVWALGRAFHGIAPNGPLKSVIIQSEDSDGDIAEVWTSILHVLHPTLEERAMLDANVRIVTDRVNRGLRFIQALRRQIETFPPDLVFLNPLQAFIDGDVTESRDLGAFLREGLNGVNSECRFGYIIVHHTTKPATGKDRAERLWHEVMYDMAGGAELINWARAIMSLRPGENEGEFRLVLAKRGRRAGVVKMVEQGIGTRPEPVTVIGLRHATGKLPSGIPIIYWEAMDHAPQESAKSPAGRKRKYAVDDFTPIFPQGPDKALGFRALHKFAQEIKPSMGCSAFEGILEEAMERGALVCDKSNPRQPRYYAPVKT